MCYPMGPFICQGDLGTMPVLKEVNPTFLSPCIKLVPFSALVFSLLSAPAMAASVVLENGDRLTGEVIKLSDNILTFKSPIYGEIKLPWKKVSELISDDGVTVQLKNGSTAKGKVALSAQGDLVIDQGDLGRSKPLKKADVALFNPPPVDNSVKYSGRANLGGVFNRGNSEDEALNFDAEFVARTPENR